MQLRGLLLIKRPLLDRPFVSLQSLNAVGEDLPLSAIFFSSHSQASEVIRTCFFESGAGVKSAFDSPPVNSSLIAIIQRILCSYFSLYQNSGNLPSNFQLMEISSSVLTFFNKGESRADLTPSSSYFSLLK